MEKRNALTFLREYNKRSGQGLSLLECRDKPDFIIGTIDRSILIAVETTLAMHPDPDNLYAKNVFERNNIVITSDDIKDKKKFFRKAAPAIGVHQLAPQVSACVSEKTAKVYTYRCEHPILLVVGVPHPFFGVNSLEFQVVPNVSVPANNGFREIWLNAFWTDDRDGLDGIIRLA